MRSLSELDANFILPEGMPDHLVFYDGATRPFDTYGLAPNREGVFCRLPEQMLARCSEGIQTLAYHLAGACIRFSTDADHLGVLWELIETENIPHFAASGQSGMELFEETENGTRHIQTLIPVLDGGRGCKSRQANYIPLPGRLRNYVLYLPLYNGLGRLLLGFPPGAVVSPGRKPGIRKPIVFYGSSITQGGCASKAGSSYSTLLCRRLDAPQINLGFSGNGKGEALMADYIAGLSMSAFVMDYDHNAPTPEYLAHTHEAFFRMIREKQPALPILIISKPDFDVNPEEAGLRRSIIKATYEHALAGGDKQVYFADGQALLGQSDRDMCTVDGTHPNDLGFWRMAEYLEPILRHILKRQSV